MTDDDPAIPAPENGDWTRSRRFDSGDLPESHDAEGVMDVFLSLGFADCEVSSSRIESYDDQRVSITLTEEGFREYLLELREHEFSASAEVWLQENPTGGEDDGE